MPVIDAARTRDFDDGGAQIESAMRVGRKRRPVHEGALKRRLSRKSSLRFVVVTTKTDTTHRASKCVTTTQRKAELERVGRRLVFGGRKLNASHDAVARDDERRRRRVVESTAKRVQIESQLPCQRIKVIQLQKQSIEREDEQRQQRFNLDNIALVDVVTARCSGQTKNIKSKQQH